MLHSLAALVLLAWPLASAGESPGLRPSDRVAICGDSVTEAVQYSAFIGAYLLACQPEPGLSASCFGAAGDSTVGFLRRLEQHVVPFAPTVATLCYGMSDGDFRVATPAMVEAYRTNLLAIVAALRAKGVRLVVIGSPSAVDSDSFPPPHLAGKKISAAEYNATLAAFAGAAQAAARESGAAFADVNGVFTRVMGEAKATYGKGYHVAGYDGLQPDANGQLAIAYAFLRGMGCPGDIATITVDAQVGTAEATPGTRVVRASAERIDLESTRYPFCFTGKPEDPRGTVGMLAFLPFNQDLNRYRLVVRNPPPAGMAVTWGTATKTFSAEALRSGVNLAAEFIANPFAAAFAGVLDAVRRQQRFDVGVTGGQNGLFKVAEQNAQRSPAKGAEAFKRAQAAAVAFSEAMQRDARGSVVPVQHSIGLSPAP
jgi:hypothetical protein